MGRKAAPLALLVHRIDERPISMMMAELPLGLSIFLGRKVKLAQSTELSPYNSRQALEEMELNAKGATEVGTPQMEPLPDAEEPDTPVSSPLRNPYSIKLMERLEDVHITFIFTLDMLGPPKRRRGLAECLSAGHLTVVPATYGPAVR